MEKKICNLEKKIKNTEDRINVLLESNPSFLLYRKIHEKYYYSKGWSSPDNEFSMLMFLMRMLRRKSNIPLFNIKLEIEKLKAEKVDLDKSLNDLQDELNKNKSLIHELSEYREKIIASLKSEEEL